MKRLLLTALLAAAPLAHAQKMPVTTASDAARLQYVQGVTALAHADFATARTHLDAALAADPSFAMAHMYRATAGADGRAEHLRQATTLGARASEGERQMIAAYAADQSGDIDREVQALTALAGQYPNDPLPMFIVANVETGRGNPAAAVAAAQRALAADPSFAQAYNTLGYAQVAAGDLAAAEAALRSYVRLAPDQANPYDSLGEFYLNQGKLDEAAPQFEMALTKDPTFAASRDNLTRIAITRAGNAHLAAGNRQDVDAVAAFYSRGAVVSLSDGSQLVGLPAIREALGGLFAAGRVAVAWEPQEITPMGDGYVYQRLVQTAQIGAAAPAREIVTLIWAMTPDGWKIARDTATAGAPPMTASR